MIETLDRMGIRPQERRSVILLLLAFLIIGNIAWLAHSAFTFFTASGITVNRANHMDAPLN